MKHASHEWGPHNLGLRWTQCQACEVLWHEPEAGAVCAQDPAPIHAARDERTRARFESFRDLARAEAGVRREAGFASGGVVQVVDFKLSSELRGTPESKAAQLEFYRRLVRPMSDNFTAISAAASRATRAFDRLSLDLARYALTTAEPYSAHWFRLLGRLMRLEFRAAWRDQTRGW